MRGCTVQLAEKCRCALWGVSASPLYLQQTVSVGVLKCVGQVQGYDVEDALFALTRLLGDLYVYIYVIIYMYV